jgi:hypothetical protein
MKRNFSLVIEEAFDRHDAEALAVGNAYASCGAMIRSVIQTPTVQKRLVIRCQDRTVDTGAFYDSCSL